MLSKARAAHEARERKRQLPWQRARNTVRELHHLPAGCVRVIDALAEGHHENGASLAMAPVYRGFGNKGDRRRVESARAPAADALPAIAEACGMTRRWVIACIGELVSAGVVRRLPGGPHPHGARGQDGRLRNLQDVLQGTRRKGKGGTWLDHPGALHECAVGGAGWANGYLVDGIPDPEDPEPPPVPVLAEPVPEPARPPGRWSGREAWERAERERRARGP